MNAALFDLHQRASVSSSTLTSPGSPAQPPGRLGELAFLVGSTWASASAGGVIEESFAWGPGMTCIQTVVVQRVNGVITMAGNGLFAWNAAGQKLMSGSFLAGTYYASQEVLPAVPDQWSWLSLVVGPAGASETTALMVKTDDDTFEMRFTGFPPRVYRREPPR